MGKIANVVDVSGSKSVQEVLSRSKTDFGVSMVPAIIRAGAKEYGHGGYNALVREDTQEAIGMVASRYRLNDHRSHLYALDKLIQDGDLQPLSVSVWDNGAVLAYQFRAPNLDMVIHDKDIVSPLLTLAFGYDGKMADLSFFSDFRWFCKNQMGKVAELAKGYRVAHKGDNRTKYAELVGERLLQLSGELSERYSTMRRMTTHNLSGRALVEYVGSVIGAEKTDIDQAWVTPKEDCRGLAAKVHEVIDCHAVDDAGAPGTVWQAYNAVTRYQTHVAGRNEASRQRNVLLVPGGQQISRRAWDMAAGMVA